MHAGSIALHVAKYVERRTSLAVAKMPGSEKRYLRSWGDRYLGSTREGLVSTAAKAETQELIGIGTIELFSIGRNLLRLGGPGGCERPKRG
jgi:hypothetical protein